jgi:hypothetical protein
VTFTPKAILTLVGTFGYLGLAVLGWGGFAAFFSHSALTVLVLVTFVLSGAALFTRGNLSPGEREDRSNRWVIWVFALVGLLAAHLPAYTDRVGFWTFDGDTVRWLGRRWCAPYLAGLCTRQSLQWIGRNPAGPFAGYEWDLRRHPPPQLSRIAR